MSDLTGVVERYLESWNESDPESRRDAGNVDTHHDVARFGWELIPASGGQPLVVGFDVAVAAQDGRLRSVYGFLDKAPGLGWRGAAGAQVSSGSGP